MIKCIDCRFYKKKYSFNFGIKDICGSYRQDLDVVTGKIIKRSCRENRKRYSPKHCGKYAIWFKPIV